MALMHLAIAFPRSAEPVLLLTPFAFQGLAELGPQVLGALLTVVAGHAVTLARRATALNAGSSGPPPDREASLDGMAILDRIEVQPGPGYRPDAWYFAVPAIAQLRTAGLDLTPATVIVGENGTGKSTLMESLAHAWAGNAFTGAQVTHWAPPAGAEDADLGRHLRLRGERPAPQGGCFLRAEAMHDLFTAVDATGTDRQAFGGTLNTRSHGESFIAYLETRTTERGLFLLDEPEAALSFTSCLRLLSLLDLLVGGGNQVVLATHSPVLAALPNARILEFGDDGITQSEWADLELVQHWQAFLSGPQRYLRYLVAEQADG
jgi:predicted ATPase